MDSSGSKHLLSICSLRTTYRLPMRVVQLSRDPPLTKRAMCGIIRISAEKPAHPVVRATRHDFFGACMRRHRSSCFAASGLAGVLASACLNAQKPPAIRQLGPLDRFSADSLASAAEVVAVSGGRAFVNDITGRRVVLFDSTLTHPIVVADTTSATVDAYGSAAASLIRYRGDSALLIAPASLSMLVLAPNGKVARVMATPRPNAQALGPGSWGAPGIDARGRLLYFDGGGNLPGVTMLQPGVEVAADGEIVDPRFRAAVAAGFIGPSTQHTDSAFIVRVDLATRALDTVTSVRIPKAKRVLKADANHALVAIETTPDPLPIVDAWAITSDGSVAIVRGRDYHVDWIDGDGRRSTSPKMPFEWKQVSDAHKETLIDSAVKAWQATFDRVVEARRNPGGAGGSGRGGASGGRGGGGGGAGAATDMAPNVAVRPALGDLPDYVPPFTEGAARADADGNLWVRTTTSVDGRPVYDIVNRRGELVDRVQLPAFRTIAGFGPGVIYMAVQDKAGIVHLERAKIK